MTFVVVLSDGLSIGPFSSIEAAREWAIEKFPNGGWQLRELQHPDDPNGIPL